MVELAQRVRSLRIRRPKYIENALNMVPLKNELDLLCTDVEQVGQVTPS